MKSIITIVLLTLVLCIPLQSQGESVFVSSDAVIIMTVPDGWSVSETASQTVNAVSDSGVIATIQYGDALELPVKEDSDAPRGVITILSEDELQNRDERSISLETQLAKLPELINEEAILVQETIRQENVYQLVPLATSADAPPEQTDSTFYVDSDITGITRFTISGSDMPIVEMLELYYAYDSPAPIPFDCNAVEIAQSESVPGAIIEMTHVPPGLDSFEMYTMIPGFEDPQGMYAYARETSAYFLAPIYPDLRLEGGPAIIQLQYNGEICKEFEFTIAPMTPVEGEAQRYAEAIQRHIDVTLDFFGVAPERLYDSDIQELLIPLATAQYWVDHPDNPDSLVNVLNRASQEELDLLNALIANDGYVNTLNRRTAIIEAQPPLFALDDNASIPLEYQYLSNRPVLPRQPSILQVGQQVSISNAEELGYYMRLQAFYEGGANSLAGSLGAVDTANNAASVGVAVSEGSGVISAGTASKAGVVGSAIGVALFTASTTLNIYQNLLPSEFTSMSYYFDKPRFRDEDEDNIYQLENAWVNVKSRSFPVTKTIADAIVTVIGEGAAAKGISGASKSDAAQYATGKASDYISTGNSATAYGVAGAVCGNTCANDDTVVLGPYTWKGIEFDFTDEDLKFLQFEIVDSLTGDNPSIETLAGDRRNQYRAIDDGLTVVSIKLVPEAFGGRTITERASIYVDKIEIYTDVPLYAEPKERVCVTATRVDHALDETLEWEFKRFDSDRPIVSETTNGDAPHRFCFTMPEPDESEISRTRSYEDCKERERAAYLVTAESTTETGARAYNGDEPRISVKAVYTLNEQDICEGLWTVESLREDEDFCDIIPPVATPRGPFANLNFIMDRAIAGGGMNSLIDIEVLNNGDQLRVTDVQSGQSRTVNRLEDNSNAEDLNVEIILQDEANNQSVDDNARTETWEQEEGTGDYILVRAPSGSTLWLDGQRYRAEVPELNNLVSNGTRVTEPYRVNTLFVSPELFISVVSWRFEGSFNVEGVSHDFDCDIDVVGIGELITGEPEKPEDESPSENDEE